MAPRTHGHMSGLRFASLIAHTHHAGIKVRQSTIHLALQMLDRESPTDIWDGIVRRAGVDPMAEYDAKMAAAKESDEFDKWMFGNHT